MKVQLGTVNDQRGCNTIKNQSEPRIRTWAAYFILPPHPASGLLVMYLPVASYGYARFGSAVDANILLAVHGNAVTAVRILMLFNSTFTFTLVINALSQVMEDLVAIPPSESLPCIVTLFKYMLS